MRLLAIVGALLIVFGVVALAYQGFTFVTRDTVAEVGPINVSADRAHTIFLHPILGAAAVGVGALMLVFGLRKPSA
jgi:hypothetical protein